MRRQIRKPCTNSECFSRIDLCHTPGSAWTWISYERRSWR